MQNRSFVAKTWWPFLVLPLLPLLLAIAFSWRFIEADILNRSNEVLTDSSIEWATTKTRNRGRDVLVTGQAPNAEAQTSVISMLENTYGIRSVTWHDHTVDTNTDNGSIENPVTAEFSDETQVEGTVETSYEKADVTERITNQQCQALFNQITDEQSIQFVSGSNDLLPISLPLLDELAQLTQRCPEANFDVIGHTDSVGDKAKNLALSLARAEAVVNYFVRSGIDENRFSAHGHGPNTPVASNATQQGRAKNRRVEFVITN